MANVRHALLDCILKREKVASFERRYNTPNLRIPFRINWIAILTVTASILLCQFAESVAERQASPTQILAEKQNSRGGKYYDRRCLDQRSSLRRSMTPASHTSSNVKDPAVTSRDIVSRLEAAVILRDNLVTMLGRVLLLCLDDDARIPFELVHDVVRSRRVAVYDLLPILPALRNKLPKQQLYRLLQMLEKVDNQFVSEYASLCINIFHDISAIVEQAPLTDALLNVDPETIKSISRDKHRRLSLTEDVDSLLRVARNDIRTLNLRAVSAILTNYPVFDLRDPEVHDAISFVAQRMKERSREQDPLFRNIEPNLENATDFLRTVLERLEEDELLSKAAQEAISLLLQNLGGKPYPLASSGKNDPKMLLTLMNSYYPTSVTAVAKYLADHLDDSHLRELDIGFYETGDQALLQTLLRLRRKSNLQHLSKPLSLLTTFVSQKLAYDDNYAYTAPISQYEVNDYLDSFDTLCLQQNASDAMRTLRSHLSEDLPWTYAFRDKRASDDPRELMLLSLTHLRSIPISKAQAIAIDNFVYKSRASGLTGRRSPLYDSGIIFQRDDSTDVEVDLFSLLMRIPNAFRSEKFTPLLNFLSKPNILDILGYDFNKFEHETPRNLLLAMLKRALTLAFVKSDKSLTNALQIAHNYLEQPLLINLYTSEDLQLLLSYLPGIENDARYLPLKILFKKKKLFTYLSSNFNLAEVHTSIERLSLILQTLSLKITQPSFSEALSFALDNFDGPPLKVRTFDRVDFVYLIQQLLSRSSTLQDELLKSSVYKNVGDWNISISGTPENVLARVLSYPVTYIASDGHLTKFVNQALSILEEEDLTDIEILKKGTLEAMLEYLPDNTYVKPVILLLKKANLMTLVPKLNLTMLEDANPSDALIMLLKSLTESRVIREEKLLMRRVRAVLSSLDSNDHPRRTLIYTYLIQSLQEPSNVAYKPLLREVRKLRNVTVSSDKRQAWLQNYLKKIVAKNETKELMEAALMALKEIEYDENLNAKTRASQARISEALSFLPIDSFAKPLRKLLTPEWTYSVLAEKLKDLDLLEKEELLLAILHHVKSRTDIADNLALMKVVSKVETKLDGWKIKVELLKTAVATAKAAIYDPVRDLLTPTGLNKMKITVPFGKSVKISLLELLYNLLQHPVIKRNDKVFELLSVVRQDVLAFGVDVDLLTVLDDVRITHISELAPVRLLLHKRGFNEKFAHSVFAIADPVKRYHTLLDILWKQRQINNDTRFHDALSILKNIKPVGRESAHTLISDLNDVVKSIPRHLRQQFKSIEQLFDVDLLSRFINDNEIVESEVPLTVLLSKIASLPEILRNRTAARELKKLQSEIEQLGDRPIVTGYQLRPLLLEIGHVQQINVDYINSILDPEVLSYLNLEEFSDEMSDDNAEILSTIVDYLLYAETIYIDYNMRKHLQSLKRALVLTMGPSETSSKGHLSRRDWKKMLVLIPHKEDFVPIKLFLQSEEIYKYIPKNTNWKQFSTPVKKLLHLLSLIIAEINDIENKNIYTSANKLLDNLEKRFNFVTEQDVKSMHDALANLKLKYDLAPLKIFLNHDNLIKYLPSAFKYTSYGTSINGLAAVLDNFLQSPSLRQRKILYKTMTIVRESMRKTASKARRSSRKTSHKRPSSKDLEFISYISPPKIREFLKPENLLNLLPQIFTLENRPTFKTKALHLLRTLLQLNTDVHSELEELTRKVEAYPDIPSITRDDLVPLLNILPVEGIPHVELIKKYLRPSTLIKLLPGNFNIKEAPKVALHNVLSLLSATLGSAKNHKLKIALDALTSELAKTSSNVIPEEALVNRDDIRSIIEEIPFKQYKQIEPLKAKMTIMNVVSSLPMNFQLTNYKTKKQRVFAVLNELSESNEFKSWKHSVNFAKRIVSKMPNIPVVNDTEIERLILPLPLNTFYVRQLVTNCKLTTLMPYLPIHFNLASLESRKTKIAKILHYCKEANPMNMSTRQALSNAEAILKSSPDFDITSEHVEVLIRTIPCVRFTLIKPLLRFLSVTNIASLLPWDLDVYRTSRTFKLRIFDLLGALRNVKELQSSEMFSALDYLEMNTKSLPEQVNVPKDRITVLINTTKIMGSEPCVSYRNFVSKTENLIQILPPNYRFQTNPETVHNEWAFIIYMSSLFLHNIKMDNTMKNAFKACVDNMHKFDKEQLFNHIITELNSMPFEQFTPLRLYTLSHVNALTAPIKDVYRGFLQGTIYTLIRVTMREFIHRPELIGSKSVINDMEVFLHDYMLLKLKKNQTYHEKPALYDIDLAIGEIPNDRKYDDLKVFLRCQEIQTPVMERNLLPDDTPKQLLMELIKVAEKSDIDEKVRKSIVTLKPEVARGIREEEVDYVLKQLRDYRYHAKKLQAIRRYLLRVGLQSVLMNNTESDFRTAYPTYNQRLNMLNERLLNVSSQLNDSEFQTELKYLNRILHNEVRIDMMPRTMDDINMQSLFLALPKTKDERIIRSVIKFFSVPDLLRRLNLPRDPFEYVTKGRLLQAIMDLGQELESVQQDPVQQEALEYFRDKIIINGPGAQSIELKKNARGSNVDVDTYGVMRAINYTKVNESNAVDVATFLDRKYDRLVYAMGFNHMAYATRGAYLKALFEHLVNISQVPDDAKKLMKTLIPAVRLDGPGEESIDLNVDVVHEEATFQARMFADAGPPVARFGRNMVSHDLQENKDSLKAAVDYMLETISSSEEENLDKVTGQDNTYIDKTRIVIGAPQHQHDIARQRKNFKSSRFEENSFRTKRSSNEHRTKIAKTKKDSQSTASLVDNIVFEIPIKHNKAVKKGETESKIDSSRESNNLGYFNSEDADSSIKSRKKTVESLLSRNSLSEKLPKKSQNRKHDKSVSSRILLQPDSTDVDDDLNGSSPIARMLRDMLLRDEEKLSLLKELMAEQTNTGESKKTVKKDLSRHTKRERKEERKKKSSTKSYEIPFIDY